LWQAGAIEQRQDRRQVGFACGINHHRHTHLLIDKLRYSG